MSNVSYYRLSAYMLPFKEMDKNGIAKDKFLPSATWGNIYDLYKFDSKLLLLVFDAIERIEIALRTQIIYQLSHKYGPHRQDNASIFDASPEIATLSTIKESYKEAGRQCHIQSSHLYHAGHRASRGLLHTSQYI